MWLQTRRQQHKNSSAFQMFAREQSGSAISTSLIGAKSNGEMSHRNLDACRSNSKRNERGIRDEIRGYDRATERQ
jgi:hypothetical protein